MIVHNKQSYKERTIYNDADKAQMLRSINTNNICYVEEIKRPLYEQNYKTYFIHYMKNGKVIWLDEDLLEV